MTNQNIHIILNDEIVGTCDLLEIVDSDYVRNNYWDIKPYKYKLHRMIVSKHFMEKVFPGGIVCHAGQLLPFDVSITRDLQFRDGIHHGEVIRLNHVSLKGKPEGYSNEEMRSIKNCTSITPKDDYFVLDCVEIEAEQKIYPQQMEEDYYV